MKYFCSVVRHKWFVFLVDDVCSSWRYIVTHADDKTIRE